MTTPTTNQPTPDAAGEAFDEAVAEAFDRDCMRDGFRDKEHEHNAAQAAIRHAADTLAAERVKAELAAFWHELPPYKNQVTAGTAYALFCNRIGAIEAKEPTS